MNSHNKGIPFLNVSETVSHCVAKVDVKIIKLSCKSPDYLLGLQVCSIKHLLHYGTVVHSTTVGVSSLLTPYESQGSNSSSQARR